VMGVNRIFGIRRKRLLVAAGLAAIALPIAFGHASAKTKSSRSQAQSAAAVPPAYMYDVVSVKPHNPHNRPDFGETPDGIAGGANLAFLILAAYGPMNADKLSRMLDQAPSWVITEFYDIDAKMDDSVADEIQKLSYAQRKIVRQQMLQTLLTDRFGLKVHTESQEGPVWLLVIDKTGKLHESKSDCDPDAEVTPPKSEPGKMPAAICGHFVENGPHLLGQKVTAAQLAFALAGPTGRPVLDKTGLTGKYDMTLDWNSGRGQMQSPSAGATNGASSATQSDSGVLPLVFTALKEQLGLKLESGKGPVEVLVIDHAERPSGN
jgi:uncharacterized protein (TIGR03435 family)